MVQWSAALSQIKPVLKRTGQVILGILYASFQRITCSKTTGNSGRQCASRSVCIGIFYPL